MRTVAIVQARMRSARLPRKVMKRIGGVPMIEVLLSRLSRARKIDQIVVATSADEINQPLVSHVEKLGFLCFRGSENDVLQRYLDAASHANAEILVRITADCPMTDPELVDQIVQKFEEIDVDYLSNTSPPTYPDGLDIEVFKLTALRRAGIESHDPFDREHVTPYLRRSDQFTTEEFRNSEDLSLLRWTVDESVDLEVVNNVFSHFSPDIHFSWREVLDLQRSRPDLFSLNQMISRNEGALIGSGPKLWKRAKSIIPGGGMLLSKRAEMFLPGQWPTYFSKAKGCKVWDLDGKEYIDMSMMGIGTNILGYGHDEVDEAVISTVKAGNMSTLNCPEEVYLAEKLIEMHPWADMVRFARTGGESNAIAIRIGRAASGRDNIAVCGYHGWHDWYLSANLAHEQNLDGHLLPGLKPNGVPKNLRGTVFPFDYNNFDQLEHLVESHNLGAIKMEVARNQEPAQNFLHKVRELATKNNIVLIFDECTSGFRETFGGLHKKYGVEPDMAIFGKSLGNGYAITAVVGRREIMEATQSSFVSSTFWTERIGPTAALKTLEVMEREKSWEKVTETGLEIRRRWQTLAEKYELKLLHSGLAALTGFKIESDNELAYKTLITQQMLNQGYLAGNCIYASTEHTKDILDGYFDAIDPIFNLIHDCEHHGQNIFSLLNGPICHSGFKRLN